MHDLRKIIICLNNKYEDNEIMLSAKILKENTPYIILLEDHSRRTLDNPLYQYPDFIQEIESSLLNCLNLSLKDDKEKTDFFVSKALLYSPYHYLITFL